MFLVLSNITRNKIYVHFILHTPISHRAAERLGLPFLNAYLDSLQPNFQHGANFAASGSTIQPVDSKLFGAGFNPLSLNIQLSQFERLKERSMELYNPG